MILKSFSKQSFPFPLSSLPKLITALSVICRFSSQNSERTTDSKWIYSSKYDQMESIKKGRIFITTDIDKDCHDVTMRMYNALMKDSNVVVSYDMEKTEIVLKTLRNKDRLVDEEIHNNQKTNNDEQQEQYSPTADLTSHKLQINNIIPSDLSSQQIRSFSQQIQISKYVDMQIDMQSIMKKKNDLGNVNLLSRQKQLKKYLKNRQFRTQLQKIKIERGYPEVIDMKRLLNQQQKLDDSQIDVKYFYENGIDVTYVLSQFDIHTSKSLRYPYEILPSRNQLINTIVSSGFPADRFSIQYFPQCIQKLQQILLRRKRSKLTVALVIQKNELQRVIQCITQIYGKEHMIFMENKNKRGSNNSLIADRSFRGRFICFMII